MIGQKLRHYRIETKLGQGGMGIVYRARDTRLDRYIALKVLPSTDASDPDRKSRLAQEARAASALNHPNIITIYDIGSDGPEDNPVDFIAMEFVQGKPLDRLIGRKGLKLADALEYAIQIADAIAAAHASGIIHRDLKPANIMVSDQGLVKVLDFGLAKAPESEPANAFAATESVKIAPDPVTEAGTILGTVAYMSPEQAEGKRVDARSDIFSFGSMLYEMMTGVRPFTGDSKLSVLATILQKDPRPLDQVSQGIPFQLERIIHRCLRKDPQERWQSMADIKVALEDLLADFNANRLAAASSNSASRSRRTWIWLAAAALAVVCAAAIFTAFSLRRGAPVSYQRLTFRRGDVSAARFAPASDTIVYSAAWDGASSQIFTTIAGSHQSRSLDLPGCRLLAVSSTGELAIVRSNTPPGMLARVPLAGGAPRDVLDNVVQADWSPDGAQLAVVHAVDGHNRLEYPIGKVLYENDQRPPLSPRISPKGDLVAFYEYNAESGDYAVVVVGPHTPKRILSRGWRGISEYLDWRPQGDEVWFSATHLGGDPVLRAVDLSGRERVVGQIPGWLSIDDIARDGRVLLTTATSRIALSYEPPGGGAERDLSWLDTSRVFDLSPDSKQLLFVELSYGENRNTSIYLRNTDGSPAILLGYGNHPSLSLDGKWVAAIGREPNRTSLTLLPTGAGEPKDLTTPGMHYDYVEWFPSGDRVLFNASSAGGPPRTYIQRVAGGAPQAVTPPDIRGADISPDGASIITIDRGNYFVYPLQGGTPRPIRGMQPGDRPLRWAADGRRIFIERHAEDAPRLEFYRLDPTSGARELLKQVGPVDPVGAQMYSAVITPDGKSYAYSFQRDLSSLYLVNGLK